MLAEDAAPLFVTQTVHHRGVTDDVGEEDGPKGGVGPRGGALSYGAPTDELHDRREGEAEVLPGRDVRTREREEARAFDGRGDFLSAVDWDHAVVAVVHDKRRRGDL